jgi:cbb3-type cytochrome oxidase subunit 3
MLKPKGQSISQIAFAGVEALAFSICFYTVVAWIVLRLWPRSRPSKAHASKR